MVGYEVKVIKPEPFRCLESRVLHSKQVCGISAIFFLVLPQGNAFVSTFKHYILWAFMNFNQHIVYSINFVEVVSPLLLACLAPYVFL